MKRADGWSRGLLYVVLLGSALAFGADRGWFLAAVQLGTLLSLLAWLASNVLAGRLEWRRTALDLPLALLVGLVAVQLLLGNRLLVDWALASPPALDAVDPFPSRLFGLGTIAPWQTARSLLWLLTYGAIYYVVINVVRERVHVDRLVRTLVVAAGVLAFFALLDYLTPGTWLPRWRGESLGGRLAGPFANPDHFATWLGMAASLGVGYLSARRARHGSHLSLRAFFQSREGRERVVRRQLPFAAVAVIALALVFTLSRGGMLSVLLALSVLLLVSGMLGITRWSLVLVGALAAVILGYGAWIGLDPLVRRAQAGPADLGARLTLLWTSLPILETFPLLGVGLGTYKDIYFRYQPLQLGPGAIYYAYAHNDLLQLAVETGLVGCAVVIFTVWRVGGDLLGAHLLGHGRCPVAGGENSSARRHDPFSTGIALGALGAVLVLLIHSLVDFSARIPANGVLGAACLGIATVALHTRFGRATELLNDVRTVSSSHRPVLTTVLILAGLAVALGTAHGVIRAARVGTLLADTKSLSSGAVDHALALDPGNVRGLVARGELRLEAGARLWQWGAASATPDVASREAERREATALLDGAVSDLRAALARAPTDPTAHERLGWSYAMLSLLRPEKASLYVPMAVAHARRAIMLAPENPLLRRSLAALALSANPPLFAMAVQAGREAVTRDPALLADLVERLAQYRLDAAHWLALVPPTAVDRLHLAILLEARGLRADAHEMYGRAVEVASPAEAVFARWALARSSLRRGDPRGALEQLQLASQLEPDNPELSLTRAQALAALGDPGSVDAHRSAVVKAQAQTARGPHGGLPFTLTNSRARTLASTLLDTREPGGVLRYRRALARALTERKAWDDARLEWETIQAEAPNDAAAHFHRAVALDHLGHVGEALEGYRRAIALDGQGIPFRLRYAQRLWETDRYVEAVDVWREVTNLAPQNVEARTALVRAYLRLRRNVEALSEYQEVVRLAPDHPDARRGFDALMQAERRSGPAPTSR